MKLSEIIAPDIVDADVIFKDRDYWSNVVNHLGKLFNVNLELIKHQVIGDDNVMIEFFGGELAIEIDLTLPSAKNPGLFIEYSFGNSEESAIDKGIGLSPDPQESAENIYAEIQTDRERR